MSKKVRLLLKKDQTYKTFKRIIKNEFINVENYTQELTTLHAGRKLRGLKLKKVGARSLAECNLQEVAYRGRCVGMVLEVNKELHALQTAYTTIFEYLVSTYNSQLVVRTVGDRETYWRNLLKAPRARISDLENLIENIEYVVEDIDKGSYTLSRLAATLDLNTKRENMV